MLLQLLRMLQLLTRRESAVLSKSSTASDASACYFSNPPASPTIDLTNFTKTISISSDTSDKEIAFLTPEPEMISISSESQITETSEDMTTPSENYMADDEALDNSD